MTQLRLPLMFPTLVDLVLATWPLQSTLQWLENQQNTEINLQSGQNRVDLYRECVLQLMVDHQWHTVPEMQAVGGLHGDRRWREIRVGRRWEKRNNWEYRLV